jgi:hypothetical membrane protein
MRFQKLLLACGVLASLLYVGTDVLAAIVHPDYHSFTSRAISELMARGAPTERLVDPFFLLYGVLMMAFGVGVLRSDRRRRVRATGGLLLAYAVLGLPGPVFFEMNQRGSGPSTDDVLHIALTAILVLLCMASLVVGASIRGRRFCRYSWVTLVLLASSGTLTSFASRGLATGEPTPWLGTMERITIGLFLAWVAVLSIALLRDEGPYRGRSRASG